MSDGVITMTLPADSRFVATARITTASIAAELEYSVEEIEDLRVGVNELVAVLLEWAEDHGAHHIDLAYTLAPDELEIRAAVAGARQPPEGADADALDHLTTQILGSVVDEFDIGRGQGRILKRRAAA